MLSASKKLKVFRRDGFKCAICRSGHDLTVDHIIPRFKGGSDDEKNLQTLCKECNIRKGHSVYLEEIQTKKPWYKKLFREKVELKEPAPKVTELEVFREQMLNDFRSMTGSLRKEMEDNLKQFIPTKIEKNGYENTLRAINQKSKERDIYLKNLIFMLCDEVERLHNKIL